MAYQVDQDIEVLWNNSWYPATVVEIGEKKSYLVKDAVVNY